MCQNAQCRHSKDDQKGCHLDFLSPSISPSSFFFSCGVASDSNHEVVAKSTPAITACINTLSHISKYLSTRSSFSPESKRCLSITCSNTSVQRCALGQSQPAATLLQCISPRHVSVASQVRRPSLSCPRLVCGHVFEAYQWLPEHPVTLQSRASVVEGHSHVAQGREEERTGEEAGRPLSLCSRGELFP